MYYTLLTQHTRTHRTVYYYMHGMHAKYEMFVIMLQSSPDTILFSDWCKRYSEQKTHRKKTYETTKNFVNIVSLLQVCALFEWYIDSNACNYLGTHANIYSILRSSMTGFYYLIYWRFNDSRNVLLQEEPISIASFSFFFNNPFNEIFRGCFLKIPWWW